MVSHDVPLFPLDTVLFPHMILPLHIFEPRYRQMISECIRANAPFGVILIKEGQQVGEPAVPYMTGTLAKISEVIKLEDGRLYITTVGTERFRLLNYNTVKPYMTGDVELWPDDNSRADESDLVMQAQAYFQNYLQVLSKLARKEIEGLEMPDNAAELSYVIPSWLIQIELDEKQRLLEIPNSQDRLLEEIKLLRRETEFLQRVSEQTNESDVESEEPSSTPPFDYGTNFPFSNN